MRWQSLLGVLLAVHTGAFGETAEPASTRTSGDQAIIPGQELLDTSGDLGSPSLDYQDGEEPVLVAPDAQSYQFYITDLESRFGPYAPGLSEQLLGLGAAYQKQGLHAQAVEVFKRGVHVARVNDGLYSEAQIPLLQRLIESLVAVGEYETADERQYYLYRVQAAVYGKQSEEMSLAMLERAEWEREAYYLSLGDTSFMRLLRMWELYSGVLRNVANKEGNLSPQLLRPLEGLLETQYMISSYVVETQAGFTAGAQPSNNYAEESRFSMIRVSNYKQGQSVLKAMRDVYSYNEDEGSPKPVETLVKLADWHLWHQKRDTAIEVYKQAWEEMGALEDGESLRLKYFGKPKQLPALPDMTPAPVPPQVVSGHVEVAYSISPVGRIKNLEVLSNEPLDEELERQEGKSIPVLRSIRRMLFRPQFENGEPVQVDDIQKRYAY